MRRSGSVVQKSGDGSFRLATLALLLVPLLAITFVLYYRLKAGSGYPLDDSWIHLAFARHLSEGSGFGINPGQLSTGATSPL